MSFICPIGKFSQGHYQLVLSDGTVVDYGIDRNNAIAQFSMAYPNCLIPSEWNLSNLQPIIPYSIAMLILFALIILVFLALAVEIIRMLLR